MSREELEQHAQEKGEQHSLSRRGRSSSQKANFMDRGRRDETVFIPRTGYVAPENEVKPANPSRKAIEQAKVETRQRQARQTVSPEEQERLYNDVLNDKPFTSKNPHAHAAYRGTQNNESYGRQPVVTHPNEDGSMTSVPFNAQQRRRMVFEDPEDAKAYAKQLNKDVIPVTRVRQTADGKEVTEVTQAPLYDGKGKPVATNSTVVIKRRFRS